MATYSLSGSGVQALSANVTALHVTITTSPANAGAGGGNPAIAYGIATLRMGDATGYFDAVPVVGGPQWLAVPAGTTRIGYDLAGAAVLSVEEVIGGIPPFGGGGALAGLSDVALASPSDTQVLTFQASTSKWINANPASGGGGGALTTASINLTSDISGVTTTWTNLLSLSLAAGTWLAWGAGRINASSATDWSVRIWDGTTNRGSGSATTQTGWNGEITVASEPMVLAGTTTIYLQGISANGVVFAHLTANGGGPLPTTDKATWLRALKVA